MERVQKFQPNFGPRQVSSAISKTTWKLHYDELYTSYVNKFNNGETDEFTHGGYLLHELYFEQLRPVKSDNVPVEDVLVLINKTFGTFNEFKAKFEEKAAEQQGSGWVYLSTEGIITLIDDHKPVKNVALIIDLWEHAYVDKYGADRAAYVKDMWGIINWEVVNGRMGSQSDTDKMRSYIKMINS